MGQNFQFLNITREERGGAGGEFQSIYTNLDAIQYTLSRPKFPEQTPEDLLVPVLIPRSHLGILSSLPAELIDAIFEQLSLPAHAARFAATHPILFAQGFARIVRIRTQNMNRITWYKNRVALVGDYLERPGLDDLLPESDKVRVRMDRFQQRLISDNAEPGRDWDDNPLDLLEFADYYGQFTQNNATYDGPLKVLGRREYRAEQAEDRKVLGKDKYHYGPRINSLDQKRIDRISDRVWPALPPYKTAVLCNFTKRQFVRSETVRQYQWRDHELEDTRSIPYTGPFPMPEMSELYPDHLTLGATVFFLTISTNDWYLRSRFCEKEDPVGHGPGLVMGRWAGDCLAVVEPGDVEEGMLDISEEVVAMVRRFVEA